MTKYWIGVDPGFTGGLACISDTDVTAIDMPVRKTGKGAGYNCLDLESIAYWLRTFPLADIRLGLENPTTRPGEGAERCFRFGRQLGNLEAIAHVIGIHYTLISPNTWCSKLGFPGKQYDNAVAIRLAWLEQRYPEARALCTGPRGGLLDGRIDALCLAAYLKQVSGVFGKFGKRPPTYRGGGFDPIAPT